MIWAVFLFAMSAASAVAGKAGKTKVCPGVSKADLHFSLTVKPTNITLPGGKIKAGLTYGGNFIGPLIRAKLGQTISIDVTNNADEGAKYLSSTKPPS